MIASPAQGTYSEKPCFSDANDANIALEGGYESTGWTRNIAAYVTALNGGGSGTGVLVASAATGCTISGFTISNAQYGIHCSSVSPTIRDNVIVANSSDGIRLYGGNCSSLISGNSIRLNTGVGIYMNNIAAGTFTPTITNCTIGNNGSHGIYVSGNFGNKGKPNVIDSVISSNGASGVYFSQTGSDSPFSGNFLRCTISSNKTYGIYGTGGGIGYPTFTNCLVTRNGSGGIYFTGDGKRVTISHCTVADNGGYGVRFSMSSVVPETLADCIVYSNTTASLLYNQASSLYVSYSDIQGGCPAGTVEAGNITSTPSFVDAPAGDYHLAHGSAGITPGDGHTEMGRFGAWAMTIAGGASVTVTNVVTLALTNTAPSWDGVATFMKLSNNGTNWMITNFLGSLTWDLTNPTYGGNASYEWKTIYYMTLDGASNALTGQSGATNVTARIQYVAPTVRIVPNPPAYALIQEAINAAVSGQVVEVTDSGTYSEAITVSNGITVQAATGQTPTIAAPTPTANTVTMGSASRIAGFIIQSGAYGVNCTNANCVITGNVIRANTGYGIYCSVSTCVIAGNTITNNTGSGVYVSSASPTIQDNVIVANISDGIRLYGGNCSSLISGNSIRLLTSA